MTICNNKINAFEVQQAQPKSDIAEKNKTVVSACWSLISGHVGELLPLFFSRLDDDLFKMSEKAETNAMGTLFFEAMRYFRIERNGMEGRYILALSRVYEEYWTEQLAMAPKQEEFPREAGGGEFNLMEDKVLEESLAVYGMIEKGNNLYQLELFSLNQRFCNVLGEEREIGTLPISPYVLCKQFESALQSLSMDLKIKLVTYKLFDRLILGNFGKVYQNLNAHLAANGVLPSIPRNIRRQTSVADASEQPAPQLPVSEEVKDNVAYLDAFRFMQSLMDGWRNQLGNPALSSSAMVDSIIVDSREVLTALNSLQHPADGTSREDREASTENLKQHIALHLGKLNGDGRSRALGRPEEDIIDMVGMIFDFILDDDHLSAPIKCLISRLQIPVIKVAILDKSFFAKRNHPTRAFLNTLAQAGIGLGIGEAGDDNPVMKKVEEVVAKVLEEFDQDVGLFAMLLEDLSSVMDKDSQRIRIVEERTRQVTQSKEKLWLAKKAVASEITLRLQGKETTAAFRSFLYNDWKDVLVLAYLRQDKKDGEWERSLQVMDKLIWSITPPTNPQERQEVIRTVPVLLKAIKEGLESISLDPHQIATLVKDLEVCHMSALRLPITPKAPQDQVQVKDPAKPSPTNEVNIKDAELADALLEINSHLPDISNVDVEEVIMGEAGPNPRAEVPAGKIDYAQGVFREVVKRLNEGDWVEFVEEDARAWRAKLSWKSPATSLCVFVNRRGVKVLELKADDLVSRLREGRAKVIEDVKTPLMDRALSYLMQSLKNPFAKTVRSSKAA